MTIEVKSDTTERRKTKRRALLPEIASQIEEDESENSKDMWTIPHT